MVKLRYLITVGALSFMLSVQGKRDSRMLVSETTAKILAGS